jgi:Spy/CpxP family protein refolding chaperone
MEMTMSSSPMSTLRRMAAVIALATAGGVSAAPHGAGGLMPLGGPGMDRMLDQVQATAEQRVQIEQIAKAAQDDLRSQHEAGRTLRAQALQLFAQPTVDANAAEALRQQMLARHDRSSQRAMQAMLEISRVLTPEQRQQLADRLAEKMKQRPAREHGARGQRQSG